MSMDIGGGSGLLKFGFTRMVSPRDITFSRPPSGEMAFETDSFGSLLLFTLTTSTFPSRRNGFALRSFGLTAGISFGA